MELVSDIAEQLVGSHRPDGVTFIVIVTSDKRRIMKLLLMLIWRRRDDGWLLAAPYEACNARFH